VSEAADRAGLKFGTGGSGGTACWGGVYLGIWVEMRLGLHLQGVQEGTRTKEYHGCISCVSIHESIDLLFSCLCVYLLLFQRQETGTYGGFAGYHAN